MKQESILNLGLEDLKDLKEIGHGTDGTVYIYKNEYLLKIYHKNIKYILNSVNDDNYIKIYQKGNSNIPKISNLIYYNYCEDEPNNIIRTMLPKDAIKKIIERQKYVSHTTLPLKAIYINGVFAGCVLLRQKGISIHKLIGMPLDIKRKIFKNVLQNEEELLKKCVYHLDLANSPFHISVNNDCLTTFKGHSHILVNPLNFQTNFIDLDGHSTIYTEKQNDYYTYRSLENLNILALEFLLKLDYEDIYLQEDIDKNANEICKQYKINSDLAFKLLALDASLDDLYKLNKTIKR